jgi:hypothetical protein
MNWGFVWERVTRIELALSAWEAWGSLAAAAAMMCAGVVLELRSARAK